jgi:hypothetical protein
VDRDRRRHEPDVDALEERAGDDRPVDEVVDRIRDRHEVRHRLALVCRRVVVVPVDELLEHVEETEADEADRERRREDPAE